jgi:hypothetical protein
MKPAFTISGHPIPGSFYGRVLKYCHGDRHLAGLMFYRARNAADPVKWLSAGLVRNGYAWNASKGETDNPSGCRAWIDANISNIKPGPAPIGDVMGAFFLEQAAKYQAQRGRA